MTAPSSHSSPATETRVRFIGHAVAAATASLVVPSIVSAAQGTVSGSTALAPGIVSSLFQ